MSYVLLSGAKAQLSMIHDADDELIQGCIDAAEDYAANYMDRPGIYDAQVWTEPDSEAVSSSSSSAQVVPASVVRAILMLTAEYYELRRQGLSGTIYVKVPSVEAMLHMYRIGLGA